MRYYLVAGEASGDLHASHLIAELKKRDTRAEFRGIGGDLMRARGTELVRHYRHLAYMGIMPVLLHLPVIFRALKECKDDIAQWRPDVLILVDYPGFNLQIARYIKAHTNIPIFYYIAPKIWAWKERRIKYIRRDVDHVFSILPFEVDFFEGKHNCPITYVGNPTVDEVNDYLVNCMPDPIAFRKDSGLDGRPVIALLAGSRKQEISANLPRMVMAAQSLVDDYQIVVAGAPGIEMEYYQRFVGGQPIIVLYGQTYRILQHSVAALVTSGTATLEAALFRVPQVVCYYMKAGWLANLGRRLMIKVPYISLVNLVAGKEVVTELVAAEMTVANVRERLLSILPGSTCRHSVLDGYELVANKLGTPGAPEYAAKAMVERLKLCRQSTPSS